MSESQLSQWTHGKPRQYFPIARKLFGKPTFIANVRGGMVYWKTKRNSLFTEHRLVDCKNTFFCRERR